MPSVPAGPISCRLSPHVVRTHFSHSRSCLLVGLLCAPWRCSRRAAESSAMGSWRQASSWVGLGPPLPDRHRLCYLHFLTDKISFDTESQGFESVVHGVLPTIAHFTEDFEEVMSLQHIRSGLNVDDAFEFAYNLVRVLPCIPASPCFPPVFPDPLALHPDHIGDGTRQGDICIQSPSVVRGQTCSCFPRLSTCVGDSLQWLLYSCRMTFLCVHGEVYVLKFVASESIFKLLEPLFERIRTSIKCVRVPIPLTATPFVGGVSLCLCLWDGLMMTCSCSPSPRRCHQRGKKSMLG